MLQTSLDFNQTKLLITMILKKIRFYLSLMLAVMAVSFVAQPAYAQTSAMTQDEIDDLAAAIAAGDSAAVQALITANPGAAATIAQAAATQALTIAATNPTAAAAIAQVAVSTASALTVSNPAAAASISLAAVIVANNPTVKATVPAAAASVATDALAVANSPTVKAAAPAAAAAVASTAAAVTDTIVAADIIAETPAITPIDPNVVSPSS